MNAGIPHPDELHPLGSRALYEWSLEELGAAPCSPIFLCLEKGLEKGKGVHDSSEVEVLEGCDSLEHAVVRALPSIISTTVVIHDVARPFAPADLVRRVAGAAAVSGAAIAAIPLDETLKLPRQALVSGTVDRSGLWRLQSPQAYRTEVLAGALMRGPIGSSSLIETVMKRGQSPAVVLGTRANVRVVSARELDVAKAMADRRTTGAGGDAHRNRPNHDQSP